MRRRRRWSARLIHAGRVSLVVALLLAIPPASDRSAHDSSEPPPAHRLGFPESWNERGVTVEPSVDQNGMWRAVDRDGVQLGSIARTLPAAKDVVGYRGPSEAWIVVDLDLNLIAAGFLGSADTEEHVEAVKQDRKFFDQFTGWPWGGPAADATVDAVSGATLTSMALAEGIIRRIGGAKPSLVFPDPLKPQEVSDWFPAAHSIDPPSGRVLDERGRTLGHVIRTGPLADGVIGYQGPTELIMRIGDQQQIESIRIRSSFDNQPYVRYVRQERGFWKLLEGKTVRELASFSPEEAGVEGVSGATMTSLAVADTLVDSADAWLKSKSVSSERERSTALRWTTTEIATVCVVVLSVILRRLGVFRRQPFRRIWLVAVIGIIGLWSGNLLSLALVSGWSAEGVAWTLAPGLACISAVSLLAPPLTKSNPYCSHLCPHGAFQQLFRPAANARHHVHLSPRWMNWLTKIPGATLVAAYIALILVPSIDLSSWEPFHAYLFRIAGWGSLCLAAGTLALSLVIPMGYCRLGCPTGRLIDYLRRSAQSDRVRIGDAIAVILLCFAYGVPPLLR